MKAAEWRRVNSVGLQIRIGFRIGLSSSLLFFLHSFISSSASSSSFSSSIASIKVWEEQFVRRSCCSSLLGLSSIALPSNMLPALSQFKINHVGAKCSPNPIPMLPTLHHTRRPLLCRSSSSSDLRNISGLKITAQVETDSTSHLERCFNAPIASEPASMKGGQYGAFGAVTLEKSKLDLSQKETFSSPEVTPLHIFSN